MTSYVYAFLSFVPLSFVFHLSPKRSSILQILLLYHALSLGSELVGSVVCIAQCTILRVLFVSIRMKIRETIPLSVALFLFEML